MTNEETKARELIIQIIDRRKGLGGIKPSWVATEAMVTLDPNHDSHPVEYAMAHLQFRQLARSVCAQKWEKGGMVDSDQHDLWPNLQKNYPKARSSVEDEPEYIPLEAMSDQDVSYNVERLRSEASAKLKHADALEAWAASRRKTA